MAKQFQIKGSMGYPERLQDAIDLLSRKDLSSLITHRFQLERFGEALAVLDTDRDCGKVMVTIGDAS